MSNFFWLIKQIFIDKFCNDFLLYQIVIIFKV